MCCSPGCGISLLTAIVGVHDSRLNGFPVVLTDKSGGQGWLLTVKLLQGDRKGGPWGPSSSSQFFRVTKISSFLTKTQSRFTSVVLDGVLGPPPSANNLHKT